ncbi:MAG: adenylosuccinate lyase, partial [Actinobacteria bacterium]|nr:adenylosuccinate lyase [Actinomycetota bacterium]
AHYVLNRMRKLLLGLQVFPQRMMANLEASLGLVFSQPVLLALVQSGLSRDDAYRIVQDNAMRAWDQGIAFRELLELDSRVAIDAAVLDAAFDVHRSLRHVDRVFEELDQLV